ncbi:MAG: bifunctional sulfate adenylyltransferase/adenylylsulfate kinase [Thermoanaerobaculia bacterium]|nr:bifunctional sulfate adenylyltransferase/adenylylsulfate kinase [Thermoanaerobaculia bacterium]
MSLSNDLDAPARNVSNNNDNPLISPYGGRLVDLWVPEADRERVRAESARLPSIQISDRAVCDLTLLASGAFSPLDRFLGRDDYESVLGETRLGNGHLFPLPVTLQVPEDSDLRLDEPIALRDAHNDLLARLTVEEIYPWDPDREAAEAIGTTDPRHPLVAELQRLPRLNVSGRLEVLHLPRRRNFRHLLLTPSQTRRQLIDLSPDKPQLDVVAFQTRNPLHRVHEALTRRAIDEVDGTLLLHPVVGLTKPGDVDQLTRVRTYRAMVGHYPKGRVVLALLPLAMRLAGPREALWHALIRRNFGANHLIVGRDHASPGVDSRGEPFYSPYAAQELVQRHHDELGVAAVPFTELVYVPGEERYEEVSKVPPGRPTQRISGTQVREDYLRRGRRLPSWFTRPEVAEILESAYPPRHRQGFCLWLTGLSGAGKSTLADLLTARLEELGRRVTVLDGDVVRTHLSKGLGFSREDRDINVRRIGFVGAEIARHGGAVIAAAISPYRSVRNEVRSMFASGAFVEVHVATSLEVCERRDTKGLYARARSGELAGLTGVDDPYEAPIDPEITLDTAGEAPEDTAERLLQALVDHGFVRIDEVTPASNTDLREAV